MPILSKYITVYFSNLPIVETDPFCLKCTVVQYMLFSFLCLKVYCYIRCGGTVPGMHKPFLLQPLYNTCSNQSWKAETNFVFFYFKLVQSIEALFMVLHPKAFWIHTINTLKDKIRVIFWISWVGQSFLQFACSVLEPQKRHKEILKIFLTSSLKYLLDYLFFSLKHYHLFFFLKSPIDKLAKHLFYSGLIHKLSSMISLTILGL